MADEFRLGSGNWWDTSRIRFDSGTTPAPIPTALNAVASFRWPTEMDTKSRSDMDSGTATGGSMKQAGPDQSSVPGSEGALASPNLPIMGLGPSSQGMDWNQALLRGEKADRSFRSMLEEDLSSNTSNLQQDSVAAASSQKHWRQKLYSGASPEASSVDDFKQINRGFPLDQQLVRTQASSSGSTVTSQNLTTDFQVDSAAAYGLLLSDSQQLTSTFQNRTMSHPYPSSGYCPSAAELVPSWNKFPQFFRTPPPPPLAGGHHLHFTNNTPFWNAAAPALQTHTPAAPSFDEKPKNASQVRDSSTTTKKNIAETSSKRSRNETSSPLPAFKTDTASVLSETIEYIKFLHEQVSVLSTPYMKNGTPRQHQQNSDKSEDPAEGPGRDLRSRGLCLVPISSTFPVTHETTVDFWTPTFGGSFR